MNGFLPIYLRMAVYFYPIAENATTRWFKRQVNTKNTNAKKKCNTVLNKVLPFGRSFFENSKLYMHSLFYSLNIWRLSVHLAYIVVI